MIAPVQARGVPGAHVRLVREELVDPGPLGAFERGALAPGGSGVRARGPYYVLEGLAIRYTD